MNPCIGIDVRNLHAPAERLDRCITDGWETFNAPVDLDDSISGEWMHTGYLIMKKPFYVYQYATGFSAALALERNIREEWDGKSTEPSDAAERYLCFLRRGSSDYPLDLLADAGVDLTTAAPIERAIDTYRDALAEATSFMQSEVGQMVRSCTTNDESNLDALNFTGVYA